MDALLFVLLGFLLTALWGGLAFIAYWAGYGQYQQRDRDDSQDGR